MFPNKQFMKYDKLSTSTLVAAKEKLNEQVEKEQIETREKIELSICR